MGISTRALRLTSDVVFAGCAVLIAATTVLGVVQVVIGAPHAEGDAEFFAGFVFIAGAAAFAIVGVLITHRQPRNTIGWLLLSVACLLSLMMVTGVYADFGLVVDPGSLPAPDLVYALAGWMWVPALGTMAIFVVLLFPDGHLPSPRWRWLAWLSALVIVVLSVSAILDPRAFDDSALDGVRNPLGVEFPADVRTALDLVFVLFPLCMLASVVAAIQRYRRSTSVERLQLRWLATAGAFFATFFGVMLLLWSIPAVRESDQGVVAVIEVLLPFVLATLVSLIPLAIGAAILKYRLYDIDVVISKSLLFGALATFITLVYVTIVVGIGRLVGSGDRPNLLLSVAATAVVAVAFEPVRNRLQRFVNRLVYGERATPYDVLSSFADRVGGAYDAADLLPLMARTVGQGVDAVTAQVWLHRGDEFVPGASWPPERAAQPPVPSLEDIAGDRVTEVRDRGEVLGAVAVTKPPGKELTPVEARLLETLAAQAGPVLRNVRLIDDLRTSRQRLVSTQDEERRRLERNLHDGAQQSLVAVALMVRLVQGKVAAESEAAGRALEGASGELSRAIEELRDLARGIFPVVLGERGLGAALTSLAERSPIPLLVDERLEVRLPSDIERALYFVTAEVIASSGQAGASEVTVSLSQAEDYVRLRIDDDGPPIDQPSRELALQRLHDRAAVVDGVLEVTDGPGAGLHLQCTVPVTTVSPGVTADAAPTAEPLGAGQ